MESCAQSQRPEQESTWIEKDMIEDYCKLNQMGIAHSIEAYYENELVGGLYGLMPRYNLFSENPCFIRCPKHRKSVSQN